MSGPETSRRFHEALPWYVNGTLAPAEREWMEQYLEDHLDAAEDLRWNDSLRQTMQAELPQVSPDIGLDQFLLKIGGQKQAMPARQRQPGFRLWQWLRTSATTWAIKPAASFALLAIVVVQAGVIGTLLLPSGDVGYADLRSVDPSPSHVGVVLSVNFKPQATERDIRTALTDVQGSLTGGPGQLGNYLVRVPQARADEAVGRLLASGAVDTVRVQPSPPPAR